MISPEDPKDSEIEIPEADRLLSTETAETTEHILPRHHRYPRGWILICALLTILCIALTIQNIQLRGVAKCPSTFSTDLRMSIMVIFDPSASMIYAKQSELI
jgi:hypothetical protein